MKTLIAILALIAITGTASARCTYCNTNTGYTNGYYRANGTYVNGYTHTMPDSNPYNNYSTPNYQSGYSYSQPSYSTPSVSAPFSQPHYNSSGYRLY